MFCIFVIALQNSGFFFWLPLFNVKLITFKNHISSKIARADLAGANFAVKRINYNSPIFFLLTLIPRGGGMGGEEGADSACAIIYLFTATKVQELNA